MNLDLLKKLTRLANNNPNENEANLAARKVAKMLQDGNWALPAGPISPKKEATVSTFQDPRTGDYTIKITNLDMHNYGSELKRALQTLEEILTRPRTWKDVKRSEEPFWKSKPQESSEETKRRQTDFFNEFFRNMTDEQKRRWENFREGSWETKKDPSPFDREYYPFAGGRRGGKGFGVGVDWSGGGAKSNAHSTKEKRKLKCTRCGVERDTAYVGNLYVCIDCYWKEYNDKRGEATG